MLAKYTTVRLGGPAGRLVVATMEEDLIEAVRSVRGPMLVLAGGSNVVIGDDGFPGTVILVRTEGIVESVPPEATTVAQGVVWTVAAGEPWDKVCAAAVDAGLSGIESLSGIPGSAGATPVQNVGAYGQEVSETVMSVRAYDRHTDGVVTVPGAECGFSYRNSRFKRNDRYVLLSVDFLLTRSPLSQPIRYAELARSLRVGLGERAPLAETRAAVLALRASKGMMLDSNDRDTWSAGSFFTNPILGAPAVEQLQRRTADLGHIPAWPAGDGRTKVSAAWLIERAGFTKGYAPDCGTVAISGKHTLALTHRGGGTTQQLLELAREIRDGVGDRFGVVLSPEPVLVSCSLPGDDTAIIE